MGGWDVFHKTLEWTFYLYIIYYIIITSEFWAINQEFNSNNVTIPKEFTANSNSKDDGIERNTPKPIYVYKILYFLIHP